MNSDLLDEYCQEEFGHTDWEMSWDAEMNVIIKFFPNARPEWLEENIEPDGEHDDDEEDEEDEEATEMTGGGSGGGRDMRPGT